MKCICGSCCLPTLIFITLPYPTLNIKMVFGEKIPKMDTFLDFVTISLLNVITKFNNFPTYLPLILLAFNRNNTYISFWPYR